MKLPMKSYAFSHAGMNLVTQVYSTWEYGQDSKISTEIVRHGWDATTLICIIRLLFSMSYIYKLRLQTLTYTKGKKRKNVVSELVCQMSVALCSPNGKIRGKKELDSRVMLK